MDHTFTTVIAGRGVLSPPIKVEVIPDFYPEIPVVTVIYGREYGEPFCCDDGTMNGQGVIIRHHYIRLCDLTDERIEEAKSKLVDEVVGDYLLYRAIYHAQQIKIENQWED